MPLVSFALIVKSYDVNDGVFKGKGSHICIALYYELLIS